MIYKLNLANLLVKTLVDPYDILLLQELQKAAREELVVGRFN